MPPPHHRIIKPRPIVGPIQPATGQNIILKFLPIVEVLVFRGDTCGKVVLLKGVAKGVVAGLLHHLGLAVGVGGKNHPYITQVVGEVVLSFPVHLAVVQHRNQTPGGCGYRAEGVVGVGERAAVLGGVAGGGVPCIHCRMEVIPPATTHNTQRYVYQSTQSFLY